MRVLATLHFCVCIQCRRFAKSFLDKQERGKKNINGMYAAVGIMGMNAHGIWNRTVFFFSHLVCGVVFAPALVLGSNGSAGCGSQPLFISHYI